MIRPHHARTSGSRIVYGVLSRLVAIAAVAYLVVPLVLIIPISFSSGTTLSYPVPGFSLRWYQSVLEPYPWMFAFRNSLYIGLTTTVLATVLGTLAAYGFTTAGFRHKNLVTAFILGPLIVPTVITALSIYFFMADLGLLGSFPALVLAHTVIAVPFVFITVTASLQSFDRTAVRAAVSLGARTIEAFLTITLPMNLPGILSGALFAFITSFDDVVIALFLASPALQTLPRQLFSGIREDFDPSAIAVSTLLILLSVLLYATAQVLKRRDSDR